MKQKLLILIAILGVILPSLQATSFTNSELLTPLEKTVIREALDNNHISEEAGNFAIIFNDETPPLFSHEAREYLKAGKVQHITFSGLTNTLSESLNLGKLVALKNNSPVLALHLGYGMMGTFTKGPLEFFAGRFQNGQGDFYQDPALEPIKNLLMELDERIIKELNFTAYCLGGYKAVNLGYFLKEHAPSLLSKINLFIIGVGIIIEDLPFALIYQEMGNLDDFGRINSTDLLKVNTIPGKIHSINTELKYSLPISPVKEMKLRAQILKLLFNSTTLSQMNKHQLKLVRKQLNEKQNETKVSLRELANTRFYFIANQVHMAKLNWVESRVEQLLVEIDLISLPSEENVIPLQVSVHHKKEKARQLLQAYKKIEKLKTVATDLWDYQQLLLRFDYWSLYSIKK